MSYQTKRLDHLGIVAGMCDRIGLVDSINAFFPDSGHKVSIGESVKAMVLNALGFSSRALYLSPEFFENKPIDLLFRPDIQASDLNEFTLGRALDALFEKNVTTLFAQVASKALASFGIAHRFYHLDTSSFSFHGQYSKNQEENTNAPIPIEICRGYSKDNHPELKQAVLSLICTYQSTLPVWLETLDGNSSDKKSFPETIKAFTQQLESAETPCFIVDSALYTAENLSALSEVFWLTKVPETIKKAKELLQESEESDFEPSSDPDYQIREVPSEYGGVKHRWIVVQSQKAKRREWEKFLEKLEEAKTKALKEFESLKKESFNCWKDAEAALCKAEKKWSYHQADHLEFEPVPRFKSRGRPKQGAKPDSIEWKIIGELKERSEVIEKMKASVGRFVVATNLEKEAMSGEEALSNYKSQGTSVERGFRFLKDPMFFADGVYLQKPSRIMALMMVMVLSLLVYSLAEKELREKLKENNDEVPDQKGKPTQNITMRRVFQMFEGLDVLLIDAGGSPQRLILNLNDIHRKIIGYLGSEVRKCYELK